ncbi:MAG: DUF4013 domain-containing protein [Methanobrevibacter sp.]|nr:DUF4013 domain-containing protein [Methanobrevibacter sp.]
MASITDYVGEGLKYPFKDVKKLLSFGALFALLNLLSTAISIKNLDIFRAVTREINQSNATALSLKFTQLPANDIYLVAALGIVSFIITLFVMGYQYNVVKFSIDKKDDLPGFSDILNIFVNGIKILIVTVAYNIIPVVVLIIGIILTGDSSALPVIAVISAILFIIAFFLQIMAVNNMVANDSLKKAFDFGEITDKIANLGWGKYIGIVIFTIIIFMIVNVAAGFILSFLTLLFARAFNQAIVISAFIGILEGLFITSYTSVFYNRVCGSIYREAIK